VATILVIDDDDRIRLLLHRLLEAEGHQVREAADGGEGLALYRQRRADLVLCDIFMPEKEGLETIQDLLRYDPGAKVVAISGGSGRLAPGGFLTLAEQIGAVRSLTKPIDRETLLGVVRAALGEVPGV